MYQKRSAPTKMLGPRMVRLSISRRRSPARVKRRKRLSSVRTLVKGSSGEKNFEIGDFNELGFRAQARGAFREGNILQRRIQSKSDVGYFRSLIVETNSDAPDIEGPKSPRSRGLNEVCVESSGCFADRRRSPGATCQRSANRPRSESADGLVFDETIEIELRANKIQT